MKYFNLNKFIKTHKQPKKTTAVKLEKKYPVPMSATIFIENKDKKMITISTKEENTKKLYLFAYATAYMFKLKTGYLPKQIRFLIITENEGIKKLKIKINPFENFSEILSEIAKHYVKMTTKKI